MDKELKTNFALKNGKKDSEKFNNSVSNINFSLREREDKPAESEHIKQTARGTSASSSSINQTLEGQAGGEKKYNFQKNIRQSGVVMATGNENPRQTVSISTPKEEEMEVHRSETFAENGLGRSRQSQTSSNESSGGHRHAHAQKYFNNNSNGHQKYQPNINVSRRFAPPTPFTNGNGAHGVSPMMMMHQQPHAQPPQQMMINNNFEGSHNRGIGYIDPSLWHNGISPHAHANSNQHMQAQIHAQAQMAMQMQAFYGQNVANQFYHNQPQMNNSVQKRNWRRPRTSSRALSQLDVESLGHGPEAQGQYNLPSTRSGSFANLGSHSHQAHNDQNSNMISENYWAGYFPTPMDHTAVQQVQNITSYGRSHSFNAPIAPHVQSGNASPAIGSSSVRGDILMDRSETSRANNVGLAQAASPITNIQQTQNSSHALCHENEGQHIAKSQLESYYKEHPYTRQGSENKNDKIIGVGAVSVKEKKSSKKSEEACSTGSSSSCFTSTTGGVIGAKAPENSKFQILGAEVEKVISRKLQRIQSQSRCCDSEETGAEASKERTEEVVEEIVADMVEKVDYDSTTSRERILSDGIMDFEGYVDSKFLSPAGSGQNYSGQEARFGQVLIQDVLRHIWPFCTVEIYGSLSTGLWLPGQSDLDLVINFQRLSISNLSALKYYTAIAPPPPPTAWIPTVSMLNPNSLADQQRNESCSLSSADRERRSSLETDGGSQTEHTFPNVVPQHAIHSVVPDMVRVGTYLQAWSNIANQLYLMNGDLKYDKCAREDLLAILSHVECALKAQYWCSDVKMIKSSMPVVKLKLLQRKTASKSSFTVAQRANLNSSTLDDDNLYSIPVDISVLTQDHLGLQARDYVCHVINDLPGFFRPLVLMFKQILRENNLNDVYTGGLGSYALSLMVVFFLKRCGFLIDEDLFDNISSSYAESAPSPQMIDTSLPRTGSLSVNSTLRSPSSAAEGATNLASSSTPTEITANIDNRPRKAPGFHMPPSPLPNQFSGMHNSSSLPSDLKSFYSGRNLFYLDSLPSLVNNANKPEADETLEQSKMIIGNLCDPIRRRLGAMLRKGSGETMTSVLGSMLIAFMAMFSLPTQGGLNLAMIGLSVEGFGTIFRHKNPVGLVIRDPVAVHNHVGEGSYNMYMVQGLFTKLSKSLASEPKFLFDVINWTPKSRTQIMVSSPTTPIDHAILDEPAPIIKYVDVEPSTSESDNKATVELEVKEPIIAPISGAKNFQVDVEEMNRKLLTIHQTRYKRIRKNYEKFMKDTEERRKVLCEKYHALKTNCNPSTNAAAVKISSKPELLKFSAELAELKVKDSKLALSKQDANAGPRQEITGTNIAAENEDNSCFEPNRDKESVRNDPKSLDEVEPDVEDANAPEKDYGSQSQGSQPEDEIKEITSRSTSWANIVRSPSIGEVRSLQVNVSPSLSVSSTVSPMPNTNGSSPPMLTRSHSRRSFGSQNGSISGKTRKSHSKEEKMKQKPSKWLFIGNLSYQSSMNDMAALKAKFEEFGVLQGFAENKERGTAWVKYSNETEARTALLTMDQKTFLNRPLYVDYSQAPTGYRNRGSQGEHFPVLSKSQLRKKSSN